MSKYKIKKTSVETRLAIERRSAAMLPDRPTQAGLKPWDIRNALFSAIIADKGACLMGEIDRIVDEVNAAIDAIVGMIGGTSSGVDDAAVRTIITAMLGKVANERQYSADNPPPYPVTLVNGKKGDVSLSAEDVGARPASWTPTAADVGARPASWTPTPADINAETNGTASKLLELHDVSVYAHGNVASKVGAIQNTLSTVIGEDAGKSMRAVAALVVAEIVGDASDSFDTLEEIAAWIEAHPDGVAALVARIVKLEAEIVTKIAVESIANDLTSDDATKPLSAAQGKVLKTLINTLTTTVDGKTDIADVQRAITEALKSYLLQTDLNAAISQALQTAKESGEFDGASVTVVSVTESTESGGENVVTFSNGRSVKVQNGRVYMAADDYTMTAQVFAEMLGLSHVDLDNIVWVGARKINYEGEGIEQIGEIT